MDGWMDGGMEGGRENDNVCMDGYVYRQIVSMRTHTERERERERERVSECVCVRESLLENP